MCVSLNGQTNRLFPQTLVAIWVLNLLCVSSEVGNSRYERSDYELADCLAGLCTDFFSDSQVPYLSVYPRRHFAFCWSVLPGIQLETD